MFHILFAHVARHTTKHAHRHASRYLAIHATKHTSKHATKHISKHAANQINTFIDKAKDSVIEKAKEKAQEKVFEFFDSQEEVKINSKQLNQKTLAEEQVIKQKPIENTLSHKKLVRPNNNKKEVEHKRKIILATLFFLIVGYMGWTDWNKFEQEQTQVKAQLVKAGKLVTKAGNMSNAKDIYALEASQQKLKDTIDYLEKIPSTSGSLYLQAQADLANLRPHLDAVSQKLTTEDQASVSLESAHKLAIEAETIVKNPPYSLEDWKEVQAKMQEAIQLLVAIPENTYVSAQSKQELISYRKSYAAVINRITIEENAVKNLSIAKNWGTEVIQMTNATPYSLVDIKNIQSKLQQAIDILELIPSGTSVSNQASSLVQIYSNNSSKIYSKIKALDACVTQKQSICTEAETPLKLNSYDSLPLSAEN